jgi:hypothetical protein
MQASTIEPTIDPEFQALMPPLSAEERAGLEASLLAEGCRDPARGLEGLWNPAQRSQPIPILPGAPDRVPDRRG